jgi:hypothetical protein
MYDLDDEPATDFEVLLGRIEHLQSTLDEIKSLLERSDTKNDWADDKIDKYSKDILGHVNNIDLQLLRICEDMSANLSSIDSNISIHSEIFGNADRYYYETRDAIYEIRNEIHDGNVTIKQILYTIVIAAIIVIWRVHG